MKKKIELLKNLIKSIRELKQTPIQSDDLTEEQLYYLNLGYKEGLCSAAMTLADELDALADENDEDPHYLDDEEEFWHVEDEYEQ